MLKASNRNCLSASRENGWNDETVNDRSTNAFNSVIFASLSGSLLRFLLGSTTLSLSAASCEAFSSCCNNVTVINCYSS